MTWETGRPIYDRLPNDSGAWRGNETVDILTGFWDDLLMGHYQNLNNPTDWLGTPMETNGYFLDWVGIGMCGYGQLWNRGWDDDVKRRVIDAWVRYSTGRGSISSCRAIIQAICPEAQLVTYDQPRCEFARVGASWLGQDDPTLYHINVPNSLPRNSPVWLWLEDCLFSMLPVGSSWNRVQYLTAAVGSSVVSDSLTGGSSFRYLP